MGLTAYGNVKIQSVDSELRKTAFCEGGHKLSFLLMRVSIRRACTVLLHYEVMS